MTIWKYPLKVADHQELVLPQASNILSVAEQRGTVVLYVMINELVANLSDRKLAANDTWGVWIHGTGHRVLNPHAQFVGTVKLAGGDLMFHVFVTKKKLKKEEEDDGS